MKKFKILTPHLILPSVSFIGILILINQFEPDSSLDLYFLTISPVIIFFILFFIFTTSLSTIIFKNFRRGIMAGVLSIALLYLAYIGHINIFYSIIIILIVILTEFLFWKKK